MSPLTPQVLRTLSNILNQRLRKTDLVARYGGEEFVMLLPKTTRGTTFEIAESFRRQVAEYPFRRQEPESLDQITVSIGVAYFPEDAKDGPGLINHADEALYQAKYRGRNVVC